MKKSKKTFTVEQKDYHFKRDQRAYPTFLHILRIQKGIYYKVNLLKKWKCLRIYTMTS